ncbi:MAG: nuclear transport factor 2 family protein [Deltaproteobacteria bacterium]
MKRYFALLMLCACASTPPAPPPAPAAPTVEEDLAAAKALFERNIQAIQDKDRDAYLACYRQDEGLIRAGAEGTKLGFEAFAAQTSSVASEWPESLVAKDLVVHAVAPGVVYGAYRYAVTIKGVTTEGLSERVFIRGDDGWHIAVSTAFQD